MTRSGNPPSPSVSVVIPVFERMDYLQDALESAWTQTYRPHEIIVVVDGPAVDPHPLIERCGVPATVLHRPRGGPGAARNTGCAQATGNVFAFLDSDDLWLPTKLERQIAALTSAPYPDMVFTGVEQFFSPETGRQGAPSPFAGAERAGLLPSALAVPAETFVRVGGFREGVIFGEFLHWYARAIDLGYRPLTIDDALVRRRVHDANAGVKFRSSRGEYAFALKDVLDRRRGQSG